MALRSFTGPLVLFQRVLGARWVPVGTGPSDAPTLLEAAPDRRNNAFGAAHPSKMLIGGQEARAKNRKKEQSTNMGGLRTFQSLPRAPCSDIIASVVSHLEPTSLGLTPVSSELVAARQFTSFVTQVVAVTEGRDEGRRREQGHDPHERRRHQLQQVGDVRLPTRTKLPAARGGVRKLCTGTRCAAWPRSVRQKEKPRPVRDAATA